MTQSAKPKNDVPLEASNPEGAPLVESILCTQRKTSATSSPGNESHPIDLELLVDSIPALIHSSLPNGYLDYFNQRWREYLGLPLEAVEGWKWVASIHPDDVAGIVDKWRVCLASGEVFEYDARVRRADGEYRWMAHRKVPLRDERGEIVKWFGSSIDIEDRKRAEQALRRSEFYLSEGQRLTHMGSWAFDCAGFNYWSPELFRMHGLDPAGKAPSVDEYLDCVHAQDRESMANLIKRILADASPFDATKRIVRPDGQVRYIRCVGAAVDENQRLKKYVGSAIDVTEHELLTQELRRREAYLAEAQRLSHTGSFGWSVPSGEIPWSEETFRIFEYDRATCKPTVELVLERVHPEDISLVQRTIDHAAKGNDFDLEHRLLMPGGYIKHVHVVARAVRDELGNIECIGAVTDITERKRAEQTLRESETYLAEAQRLSQTGSWAWNAVTGEVRYWSEECYRVLGFDPNGPLPRFETFWQRIHPDDQVPARERFEQAIRERADFEVDYRIVHPGTGIRDIHSVGHAVLGPSGDLVEFVGTVIDITESKRAERELQQLVDLTPQVIVVLGGPDGKWIHANRVAREYTGLTLDEIRSVDMIGRIAHPDDAEEMRGVRERGFLEKRPFELEARLLGKDGVYRWFLMRYNPLVEEGHVRRWYATATEIESRKKEEERVRRENVRLEERTRIAQELHDTLLQTFLSASMQLSVALDGVAPDSLVKPRLDRILQLMNQGIAEGRNTIQGLRPPGSHSLDLVVALSRVQQELAVQPDIDFRVIVAGRQQPVRPRIQEEIYRIGREALVNAFRHSQAKHVELELEYADSDLCLRVRDDGCGIDPEVLDSGRTGHWGLAGMHERAEKIGARLKIRSPAKAGTEVELSVPNHIAFELQPSHRPLGWLARIYPENTRAGDSKGREGTQ